MKFLHALGKEVYILHRLSPQNLRMPATIPSSVWEQRGQDTLMRHGQGCGSACGCVCDIQVAVDREGVVTDAFFAAKRVVMGAEGKPLRSRRGKLLLHECSCDTLRSFGSIATSECKGERLENLRNRLLFSPSAPPSFWRTLLRSIGAPRAAMACSQIVEAALTTALTDRAYKGITPHIAPTLVSEAGSVATARHSQGGMNALSTQIGAKKPASRQDEYSQGENDDDLAEVDFRQQYDDFA